MKAFISHQSGDKLLAYTLGIALQENHQIDFYLDLIDDRIGMTGEDIGDHLRAELSKCTQLLAVVSEKTRGSWWVPWEIGVAAEKEYPLATYSSGSTSPPEFLQKWPYLQNMEELDIYANASKKAARLKRIRKTASTSEEIASVQSTKDFYRIIRSGLGR